MNADIAIQMGLAIAAVVALIAMQPRWDTGGGALMIFVLGIVGVPVWAPLLMIVCAIYLVGMLAVMAWYVIGFPLWFISRPLVMIFHRSFRHMRSGAT